MIIRNGFLELYFYFFSMLVFLSGMLFDFSWKIGWILITIVSFLLLYYYIYLLIKKKVVYDKTLFLLGMIVFVLIDPFIYLLNGLDFPYVDNGEISNNYISNKVGVIISIYISSFFIGRFIALLIFSKKNIYLKKRKEKINVLLIVVYFVIAILPYLIYGGSDIASNFLINIAARSSGYVAFSSSGLGTKNPIISLLAQSIPVTIILMAVYLRDKSFLLKLILLILFLFLLSLYISMGGRSGTIYVFLTLFILWYVKRKEKKIPVFTVSIISITVISALAIQINMRDNISGGASSKPAFTGNELNREVAYIANNFGYEKGFIRGNNIIEMTILPIVDTLALFITNPIPRILWKNKPIDSSFGPYNQMRTGLTGFETGSNITPTVPGRYYMKYGMIGVLEIGILIGFLWSLSNIYIKKYLFSHILLLLVPIISSVTLFVATRDFAPGKIYPLLFLLLFNYLNSIKIEGK